MNRKDTWTLATGVTLLAVAAWLADRPAGKLPMCWAILRGRTVAYRLSITGGGLTIPQGSYGGILREVTVINAPGYALTVPFAGDLPDYLPDDWE